jgi:hypothetical protein
MTSGDPKIAKVITHFEALSSAASSLNTASDELTRDVGTLEDALKKLNVGLTVWVPFRIREDDGSDAYDQDEIGYAKVQSNWGIALRRIWGDERRDEQFEAGPWAFNDAPRELRLLAVDKIPEVIEALAKAALVTTKRIQEKTKEMRELAGAISAVTTETKTKSVTLAERIASRQNQGLMGIPKTPTIAVPDLLGRDNKTGGK